MKNWCTHGFVARQLLSRMYALSNVKFIGLKVRLCKKRQKSGMKMILPCHRCSRPSAWRWRQRAPPGSRRTRRPWARSSGRWSARSSSSQASRSTRCRPRRTCCKRRWWTKVDTIENRDWGKKYLAHKVMLSTTSTSTAKHTQTEIDDTSGRKKRYPLT